MPQRSLRPDATGRDRSRVTGASHKRSIVVWDLPSAIGCGKTFTIRVGIKCESLCRPGDWSLAVHDHEGRAVASAVAGETVWPGTEALYGAELELTAPLAEGLYRFRVVAAAAVPDRDASADDEAAGAEPANEVSAAKAPAHEAVDAAFNVRVVPEADCRLTVIAVERASRSPVEGAKVVVHPYRALTNEQGVAELALPKGRYRVFVSGRDYFPLRIDGSLTADTTIRAELEPEPGPSDAELWA